MNRTPMKRRSKKGAAEDRRWRAERSEHLAKHPTCQAVEYGVPFVCCGSVQVHHTVPRSAGGQRGNTGPVVTLCAWHHQYVESHRADAKALGLLARRKSRYERGA